MRTVDLIGAGRVGTALQRRAEQAGVAGTLVTRETGWDALTPGPILVATRNDALADVVARVPQARHGDLVFVQNGMIGELLDELGVGGATRGLLYVAVPTKGDDLTPGPPSPFHGPVAHEVVAWLKALEVPSKVVSDEVFAAEELEKTLWNAAFGLLCEAFDTTVDQVCDDHPNEVAALIIELVRVGAEVRGLTFDEIAVVDRAVAYSRSIPGYRGKVKEWPYRNGWFVRQAKALGRSMPHHDRLLAMAGRSR